METFREYQRAAACTKGRDGKYLPEREALACWGLGVAGEAGEVADYLKKVLYHGHYFDQLKLVKEMGDVLWYLAALAETLDIGLEEIAVANIAKLRARYPDGFTHEASRARLEAS
jgi:NTP pyrophosphatase (non-canonical NTP hydrolase)